MRESPVGPVRMRGAARLAAVGAVLVASAAAGGSPAFAQADDATRSGAARNDVLLESAIDFRRDLGLRADPAYVARLEADRTGYPAAVERYGIALTDSELGRVTARERRADAVATAVERFASAHRESFAGLYIDSEGVVRAGFTADADRRLEALRERVAFPARLDAFRAAFSLRALERFARRIADDVTELSELGVHRVGVDVRANAVRVEATEATAALAEELRARYPGAPIDLVASAPAELAANYERFDVPPMVGAIQIYRGRGGGRVSCSAGFVATAKGAGRRSLITAGHCGQRGQRFRHARKRQRPYLVGAVKRDAYRNGSTADALLIGRKGFKGAASIYTPTPDAGRGLRGITSVQRPSALRVGQIVCRSGAGSDRFLGRGVFCGRVEQRAVTAFVTPGPTRLRRQVVADVTVCSGDSGGPVYYRHQARGIVSAGGEPFNENCNGELLYSQIGYVENRLDAGVATRRRR
ncbi:MAG: S1 family peptidase [Thermoleophilaceae bacterium]